MSKGSRPRPMGVSYDEYRLRYDLAFGRITKEQFDVGMEKLRRKGKLKRPKGKWRA